MRSATREWGKAFRFVYKNNTKHIQGKKRGIDRHPYKPIAACVIAIPGAGF